jgi:hypothetical protein
MSFDAVADLYNSPENSMGSGLHPIQTKQFEAS